MTAIAGIEFPESEKTVNSMLAQMAHRGNAWQHLIKENGGVLGISGTRRQKPAAQRFLQQNITAEHISQSHFARAQVTKNGIRLTRDPLGVSPLYYGLDAGGSLCFASEVKGLLPATRDIHELPPGHTLSEGKIKRISSPKQSYSEAPGTDAEKLAIDLRHALENAITARIGDGEIGAWLSGGIDSTAIAAIAQPHLAEFHTFAAGLPGSADIEHSKIAARHIGTIHHILEVKPKDLIKAIPEVIYHLESFDALLVRSSLLNYQVAKMASDYVPAVFSGEGADELFAGYEYLGQISLSKLQEELDDLIGRLHNTALQRVDRSASAHGLEAFIGFLDPAVVNLAQVIPSHLKIKDGIEKWILRKAVADLLPENLLTRKKAKFWQGSGVQEFIARSAEEKISDRDFANERLLCSGDTLNTKEELMYYRVFRQHFGEFDDLSWMGRTKGAPVN